ncbi:hypothetical protein Tco_0649882 [Tanacetum coccineum]
MNKKEIHQVSARDEKWVPTKERVKINTTNVRLETTVPLKEETFQVIIDVIKNSTCYKAFTVSNEVPEIFMQQFWYTIKKVSGTNSYEFLLANKKCLVDAEEYRLPILKTMLTEGIKQSESYQMFIKYSTSLIPPKNSIGKGSQGKKIVDTSEADVDNIGKQQGSHAHHERIMTETDPEPARRRPSGISFRDTSKQLATDTMEALKASKKLIKSQSHAKGSSKRTGTKPGVPDESIFTPTTLSEGTSTETGVLDEEKVTSEAKYDIDDEETNDEFVHSEENVQDDDEETDDELLHAGEQVNDDADEEMKKVKDADTRNCDEEITDAAKADAEKTEEAKDNNKTAELPPTSPSLSVSLEFGNQFLNLSSNTSLIVLTPIPETPSVATATTILPPPSISIVSHVQVQTTTPIPSPPITTEAPLVTTIPDPLPAIIQSVSVLEKDVQELKEVDNTTTLCASLRSEIPLAVNAYLGSSLGDALQKVLQKHTEELIQKYPQQVDYKEMIEESVQAIIINEVKNQLSKFLPKEVSDFATSMIQSTIKNALENTPFPLAQSSSQAQSSLKAAKSDRDREDPSAGPNQGKKTKRSRTKESNPSKKSSTSKESSNGKSPAKTSKSSKSVTVEELVEEPVFEMASDDIEQTTDNVTNDVDQPPDDSTQTKDKAPKQDWFKQPPRPPTPDLEWNKRQVVLYQPEQP